MNSVGGGSVFSRRLFFALRQLATLLGIEVDLLLVHLP
jgi:hypothetical protein